LTVCYFSGIFSSLLLLGEKKSMGCGTSKSAVSSAPPTQNKSEIQQTAEPNSSKQEQPPVVHETKSEKKEEVSPSRTETVHQEKTDQAEKSHQKQVENDESRREREHAQGSAEVQKELVPVEKTHKQEVAIVAEKVVVKREETQEIHAVKSEEVERSQKEATSEIAEVRSEKREETQEIRTVEVRQVTSQVTRVERQETVNVVHVKSVEDSAAEKIQSRYRGYKVRKEFHEHLHQRQGSVQL
jgi:hypothetical protein